MIRSMAITLLSLIFLPLTAWAGGWSSIGGDLLKDAHNPWFVQNTETATYCLKIDEKNMSLPASKIRIQLARAVTYWQNEFALAVDQSAYYPGVMPGRVTLTEQDECHNDTDIIFQFGYLDAIQSDYFVDPTQHIGVAVRTDYDMRQLKGKGFVYISPDRGPLSFVQPNTLTDPWSVGDGYSLYLTLLHELGHIYGLPHQGGFWNVMSISFVENVVSRNWGEAFFRSQYVPPFFSHEQTRPNDNSYCTLPNPLLAPEAPAFFGLPTDWECLRISIGYQKVEAFGKQHKTDQNWTSLGEAPLDRQEIESLELVMHIYIDWNEIDPDTRRLVFGDFETDSTYIQGPFRANFRKYGTYRLSQTGEEREIFATFRHFGFDVGGIYEGRAILDLTPLPDLLLPQRH